MKKLLITVGLLLFAAVFMSGCVTETEDPVVGIWHNAAPAVLSDSADFDSVVFVFNKDNTGFTMNRFDGTVVSGTLDFSWKNEGDGKYTITFGEMKGLDIPKTREFVLEGEVLSLASSKYHKEPAAEYLVGLWASDLSAYDGPEGMACLMYVDKDGTGNVIVYGSDVMGIDDVFTTSFTWEEKDGVMYGVEEDGDEFEHTLKNGALYNGNEETFHKYVVEDRLLGLWLSDEPSEEDNGTFDIVLLLRPDGTGTELWTLPGSHVASAKYYFTWEMTGPTTYQAVYNDGDVWEFSTVELGLTDGEVTYSKVGYDVLAEYAQKVTA